MKNLKGGLDAFRKGSVRKKSTASKSAMVVELNTYRKQFASGSEKLRSKVIARASHLKKVR